MTGPEGYFRPVASYGSVLASLYELTEGLVIVALKLYVSPHLLKPSSHIRLPVIYARAEEIVGLDLHMHAGLINPPTRWFLRTGGKSYCWYHYT